MFTKVNLVMVCFFFGNHNNIGYESFAQQTLKSHVSVNSYGIIRRIYVECETTKH